MIESSAISHVTADGNARTRIEVSSWQRYKRRAEPHNATDQRVIAIGVGAAGFIRTRARASEVALTIRCSNGSGVHVELDVSNGNIVDRISFQCQH